MSQGRGHEAELYVGTSVGGRWRLDRLVGRGGFSWVYHATWQGEEAAVKILYDARPTSVLRFEREARVLRALPENPYVTRLFDQGLTDDGRHYMVLEYVEGTTLGAWMREAVPVAPAVAVDIIVQICRAFSGLHALGVAHRDVKPTNILLPDRGGIKLIDFGLIRDAQGLLRLFEEENRDQQPLFDCDIDQWLLVGTPEYMAPEQFSDAMADGGGREQTDTWSDVFSLGVILYQLLEGRLPYPLPRPAREMDHQSYLHYARWRAFLADSVTPHQADLDPGLRAIVERTLRRDPRQRPIDARHLESLLLSLSQQSTWELEDEPMTVEVPSPRARGRVRGETKGRRFRDPERRVRRVSVPLRADLRSFDRNGPVSDEVTVDLVIESEHDGAPRDDVTPAYPIHQLVERFEGHPYHGGTVEQSLEQSHLLEELAESLLDEPETVVERGRRRSARNGAFAEKPPKTVEEYHQPPITPEVVVETGSPSRPPSPPPSPGSGGTPLA